MSPTDCSGIKASFNLCSLTKKKFHYPWTGNDMMMMIAWRKILTPQSYTHSPTIPHHSLTFPVPVTKEQNKPGPNSEQKGCVWVEMWFLWKIASLREREQNKKQQLKSFSWWECEATISTSTLIQDTLYTWSKRYEKDIHWFNFSRKFSLFFFVAFSLVLSIFFFIFFSLEFSFFGYASRITLGW